MEKELSIKKMVQAIYKKLITDAGSSPMGTPGKPAVGQIEPVVEPEKIPVWCLEENPAFKKINDPIPVGKHRLYDWNHEGVYQDVKDCGPIEG